MMHTFLSGMFHSTFCVVTVNLHSIPLYESAPVYVYSIVDRHILMCLLDPQACISVCIARSGIAGLQCAGCGWLLQMLLVFHSTCTFPNKQCIRVPVVPYPHQHLILLGFWLVVCGFFIFGHLSVYILKSYFDFNLHVHVDDI